MANAHGGYSDSPSDPQVRILLAIHEASAQHRQSIRKLGARVGLSVGGVVHHLNNLSADGLITRTKGARGIHITDAGTALLLSYDLIALARMQPIYQITARGVQLLEQVPGR